MIELLQEILDAGKGTKLPLDMGTWHCGTACCLCGDVAVKRGALTVDDAKLYASEFSEKLDLEGEAIFGDLWISEAIYGESCYIRASSARLSRVFTTEELKHPHLTTGHSDRKIAHDFVRLVMRKCEEKMQEKATCTH